MTSFSVAFPQISNSCSWPWRPLCRCSVVFWHVDIVYRMYYFFKYYFYSGQWNLLPAYFLGHWWVILIKNPKSFSSILHLWRDPSLYIHLLPCLYEATVPFFLLSSHSTFSSINISREIFGYRTQSETLDRLLKKRALGAGHQLRGLMCLCETLVARANIMQIYAYIVHRYIYININI